MKTIHLFALLACLGLSSPTMAAKVGDKAPGVGIYNWLKGKPVRVGPGTNIYVVEFWATWCGPCKKSIPKLTGLQKKFADKGVVILGISDEPAQVAAPFVQSMGDTMDYTVGVDPTKRTFRAWMTAFGEGGIPHAFIVGTNGMVWWHGYPSDELEGMLDRMVAGQIDFETAVNFGQGKDLLERFEAQAKRQAAKYTTPIGDKILADHSKDWRIPRRLAQTILMEPGLRERDLDLALRAATKAVELTNHRSADALEMQARALFFTGKKDEAISAQKKGLEIEASPKERAEMEKQLGYYEQTPAPTPSGGK